MEKVTISKAGLVLNSFCATWLIAVMKECTDPETNTTFEIKSVATDLNSILVQSLCLDEYGDRIDFSELCELVLPEDLYAELNDGAELSEDLESDFEQLCETDFIRLTFPTREEMQEFVFDLFGKSKTVFVTPGEAKTLLASTEDFN